MRRPVEAALLFRKVYRQRRGEPLKATRDLGGDHLRRDGELALMTR